MHKIILAALGAATMFTSVPVAAQEFPLVGGDHWDITSVKIDDGHFADYADFLVSLSRNRMNMQSRRDRSKPITF